MPEIRALYGKEDLLDTNDPIDFLEERYSKVNFPRRMGTFSLKVDWSWYKL